MFNKEFYPTPVELIDTMRYMVDMKRVATVLEPSAGNGKIVDQINTYYHGREKLDIDCIEIEPELQHIIRGKNHRLVHDDFLSFRTFKSYDLIMMNPPFSNGDKHLTKALDMIADNGGQVVCLLNAETLRNPYTNLRTALVRRLDELNARIEYRPGAFVGAERNAFVDVAIIYVKIEKPEGGSVILDNLKKAKSFDDLSEFGKSGELISANYIEGLIEQCNNEISYGVQLIRDYKYLAKNLFNVSPDPEKSNNCSSIMQLSKSDSNSYGDITINEFVVATRLKFWKALFQSDEFDKLLTMNLKRLYMNKINEMKDYEFNAFNVLQIKHDISKMMIQSLDDTILTLFDDFSNKHSYSEYSKNIHLYDGWKTNKAWKINKKVIIPLSGYDDWWKRFDLDYKVKERLQDIEKVFDYLNGTKSNHDELIQVLSDAKKELQSRKIKCKYFMVTFFKKGTCHIEFTDKHLLSKFNIFGSQRKGWLPPSYAKKSYEHMNEEEKLVIDQFQGKSDYNKVFVHPTNHLFNASEQLLLTA